MFKTLHFGVQLTDRLARDRVLRGKAYTPQTIQWTKQRMMTMGTAYIKIGQLISSRSDIFAADIIDEFQDFQYKNTHIIENIECNDPYITCDALLAVGSIGQLYTGSYNEQPAVIKLKKPNAFHVTADLSGILKVLQAICIVNPSRQLKDVILMIDNIRSTVNDELDFRTEFKNIMFMRRVFETSELFYVPKALYASENVLVMEKVNSNPELPKDIINDIYYEILQSCMRHSFIHGDLHSGNMGYNASLQRVVLYDFGVILRVPVRELQQLFYAAISNDPVLLADFLVNENFVFLSAPENEAKQQVEYVSECVLRYISHMNIQQLYQELVLKIDTNHMLFSLNPDLCMLIRTFALLEGTCKSYNTLSYVSILFQLGMEFVPIDIFVQKSFKDIRKLFE